MTLQLTLTHDPQRMLDLRDEWIALHQRSQAKGAALTWQWMSTWWKHFNHIAQLWLIEAREGEQLVGLAPLVCVRVKPKYGLSWRQIEFISARHYQEHLDFIIESGYENQLLPLFLDVLHQHQADWDVLHLSALSDTPTLDYVQHHNQTWEEDLDNQMIAPYITLPASLDAYLKTLSSNRRWKLRRYRRDLDEQFPDNWAITRVEDPQALDASLERLVHLHQARWVKREKEGAFGGPGLIEYFRELMHIMLAEGWLRFYEMRVADQVPVILFAYHYRGRTYNHIVGMDESLFEVPVGHVMTLHSIEEAIAEGASEYTMMWGQEPYKYSFGVQDRVQMAFDLVLTPRVQLQRQGVQLLRNAKQRLLQFKPDA